MEELIAQLAPVLNAGGSLSLVGILIFAAKMSAAMNEIKKDVAVMKSDMENTKDDIARIERKVFNGDH